MTMPRPSRVSFVACVLALDLIAPSASGRDFYAPAERERKDTAYALPEKRGAAEISFLGIGEDLVGRLGLAYGFGGGFEADLNLLHAGVGVLTLGSKWTFLDRDRVGLGLRVGFVWMNGQWVWFLPPNQREIVKDIDAIVVPVEVLSSLPLAPWFQLDLSAAYQHAQLFGNSTGRILYDTQIGLRQVAMGGSARFYLADKVQLFFTAHLPVWTRSPHELTASLGAADGAGVRRAEYQKVPFSRVYSMRWGIQSAMSHNAYLTFAFVYSQTDVGVYRSAFHPAVNVEIRF